MAHTLARPPGLFNGVGEWDDLAAFVAPGGPDSLRLDVLYGRRRRGTSEILQRLCDVTGGLYTLAVEQPKARGEVALVALVALADMYRRLR